MSELLFDFSDIVTYCELCCSLYMVINGRRYCKNYGVLIEDKNFNILKECYTFEKFRSLKKISFSIGEIYNWDKSESYTLANKNFRHFRIDNNTELLVNISNYLNTTNTINLVFSHGSDNIYDCRSKFIGNNVTLYSGVKIGDDSYIYENSIIKFYTTIDDGCCIKSCKIGSNCHIGKRCKIGNNVNISNKCVIGNYAIIDKDKSSEELNESFINSLKKISKTHIFEKWVDKNRNTAFNTSNSKTYNIGSIIEEPMAIKSDLQCTHGLHVFRPGNHPDYFGFSCICNHEDLMKILVEVDVDDICFAGLPGNSDKLRVRKLRVLS